MELEQLISSSIEWIQAEPITAGVIIGIVALLFYFRTKPMLKLCAILLVFAFLFYAITLVRDFASTGVAQKENMVEQDGVEKAEQQF